MTAQWKRSLIWITALVLATGLITAGIVWLVSRVPAINDQLPPNQSSIMVLITSPGNRTSWPADAFIPVRVSAQSKAAITQLELWVNGNLQQTLQLEPPGQSELIQSFSWLPLRAGNYRLYFYAQDDTGRRSVSNIVIITASEPAGFGVVEPGTSPAENMEQHEILPPGLSSQSPPSPPPPQEPALFPNLVQQPNNLSVWLAGIFSSEATLPNPPELSYSLDGCTVNLLIKDKADSELGYFIYRSSPGSSTFERIDTLGKIDQDSTAQFSDPGQKGPLDYYVAAFNQAGESPSNPIQAKFNDPDCNAAGLKNTRADGFDFSLSPTVNLAYVYYAYNNGSYSRYPSDPDTFLEPIKHEINLDTFVDSVVSWAPYPVSTVDLVLWGWEGGSLVNLGAWHTLVDRSDLTICNLGIGCTGDVAGSFKTTYGEVASNAEDQLHEFYWTTTAPSTTAVLWQIATQPFTSGFQPHPAGLVAAGCKDGTGSGSFLVDFADLKAYLPEPTGCGSGFEWALRPGYSLSNFLLMQTSRTYYARFTPMTGNQPSGDPSNTVIIQYGPGEDYIEPVIEDHLPLIYQVEIIDFRPIKYMDFNYWGCISIVSLDYDQIWDSFRVSLPAAFSNEYIDTLASDLYNKLHAVMANNQIVCPTAYTGSDDSSVLSEWGSSLMEGLNAFWESVQSAFNSIKDTAVDLAAGAISALGIPCEAECRAGLRVGLEIGFAYFTGMPPTLPDFDQLVDEGINYAIQMAAAEAGIPCPEACQDALRTGLEEVADLVKETQSQPACVDEDWAHLLGKNAFCFPAGVETEPVPAGVTEPASAVVRITRPLSTSGIPSPEYSYYDMPSYSLRLRVFETNPQVAGKTFDYWYSYFEQSMLFGDEDDLPLDMPLLEDMTSTDSTKEYFKLSVTPAEVAGQVFTAQTIAIPPLAPGGEITIPMSFGQVSYYFDEHVAGLFQELSDRKITIADVGGIGGSRGIYFDWGCLYNGGTIKVEAELYCLSVPTGLSGTTAPTEDSHLVPCGVEAVPVIRQVDSPPCQP